MATALKLRSDIKKLKKALDTKGISASIKDKLKSQLAKAENELASMKKGKKPTVSSTGGTKTALTKLQSLIKKKKFGVYQGQGVDLKKDADRPALPTGKRKSKSGNTYYEYRANRIDVKQPPKRFPKLEDGGYMAGGGKMTANEKWQKKRWEAIEKEEAEKYPYGKRKIKGIKEGDMYYKPSPVTIEKYDSGRDEWAVRDACGGLDRYRTGILTKIIESGDWQEGDYKSKTGKKIGVIREGDMYYKPSPVTIEKYDDGRDEWAVRDACGGLDRYRTGILKQLITEDWEKYAEGGTIDNSGMTPADLQKQILNLTARISKLGDIESRAASDEMQMLMKQREKLQSMALNHGDVVMAKGGATEHGLKRGDTIWADQFWENTVVVDNPETGRAVVNLETGKRKEQGKI